jgi:hypothetical protein
MVSLLSRANRSSLNGVGLFRGACNSSKKLVLAVCVGLFAGISPDSFAREDAALQSPTITLDLPPDIASETVQINYVRYGPFGASGGYVEREKGRASFDIPASVDGTPADAVKVIGYMPGCEIVKLEIKMQGTSEVRTLPCRALGRVPLHGRILPVTAVQSPGVEVEIRYEADWDHGFFGIADGFVTTIRVARVTPDENGQFEVELPDFFHQADLGMGSFQILLRNESGLIAILNPEGMLLPFDGLAIRSSYEPFVLFSADMSPSRSTSTDSGPAEDRRND